MPTTSFMVATRNQAYCEPFDEFDPHMPLRGKKKFNENFRPFRHNINLEIAGDAVNKDRKPKPVTIDPRDERKLREKYSEQCDQNRMRLKHRGVSEASSFHPTNKHQYPNNEKILDKPGKLHLQLSDCKKIAYSGKIGELGEKIIAAPKRANRITTGPWDLVQTCDHEPRKIFGRGLKPIAEKTGNFDMTARFNEVENHSLLHRQLPKAPSKAELTALKIREELEQSPSGVKIND